jgi:hypothetical protein
MGNVGSTEAGGVDWERCGVVLGATVMGNNHELRPSTKSETRLAAVNSHPLRNKRGPLVGGGNESSISEKEEHVSKKSKSAKPRIARYPRIKVCELSVFDRQAYLYPLIHVLPLFIKAMLIRRLALNVHGRRPRSLSSCPL